MALGIPKVVATKIVKVAGNKLEKAMVQFDADKLKRKKQNTKIITGKYAIKLGFSPIDDQTPDIKNLLNEKIITEVRKKRLTHLKLSGMTGITRPKITHILNRKIHNVTCDCLIKILSCIGRKVEITLPS